MSSAIAALRRFAVVSAEVERCELCGIELGERHEHLVEPAGRRLLCACGGCGMRFDGEGGALRRVVTRASRLELELDDADWRRLGIPVAMAFFQRAASGEVSALFPGPAGTTAAPLDPDLWPALAARHPALPALTAEVEALLVGRLPAARGAYLVSIDLCYRLTGILRASWSGLAGGDQAWSELAAFFAELNRHD